MCDSLTVAFVEITFRRVHVDHDLLHDFWFGSVDANDQLVLVRLRHQLFAHFRIQSIDIAGNHR